MQLPYRAFVYINLAGNLEAMAKNIVKVMNELDTVIAPDFYNHTGNHKGVDTLKASITMFHQRMKSVKMEVIRQFAEGEIVSDWIRYTGAHLLIVVFFSDTPEKAQT